MSHILAKDLRNAVLQSAMEGKLTTQNYDDDSAFSLVATIKDVRKHLSDNKQIKPIKTYPSEMLEDYDVPANWAKVHLGDISTYQESKKKIKYSDADGDAWSLDLEDIEKGGNLISIVHVCERKSNGDKTVFEKGDVLYSKLRPYLLKILVAPDNGICTSELVPFKLYGDINPEYIVMYLKSPYVDNYINSVTYGVKMPRVNTETMERLVVPLPPIEEQARIVTRIEELMAKIDEYEELENQLDELKAKFPEEMKASILQAAMEGNLSERSPSDSDPETTIHEIKTIKQKLVENKKIKKEKSINPIAEEELPNSVPDNWKVARFVDLFNIRSALRIHESDWRKEGVPFLRGRELVKLSKTGNLTSEVYITQKFYQELKEKGGVPKKDDILITAVGTLGKTYIVSGEEEPFYYKDAYILCLENYGLNPKYIKYVLEAPMSQSIINDETSKGTTVAQLTISKMKNMILPVPSLEEQQRIVDKLDKLLPICDELAELA